MSNLTSVGDLARAFQLRQVTSEGKANLARLTQELTTGYKSDLGAAIGGDFGPFAGIERALRATDAYKTSNSEAGTLFTAAQLALENVQGRIQELAPALLTAASARDATLIEATAGSAQQSLGSVVSNLNTRIADRTLFAGARIDAPALAHPDAMMADLTALTTGLTTAEDVETAVTAWFDDPGGGFETTSYLGSTNTMGAMSVADGDQVALRVRADDPVIRDTLKGLAMAALIAEGVLDGNTEEQANLIERAAGQVVTSDTAVTSLRAEIGTMEERIENAQARNAAQASAYELARNEMIAADPYDTATELQTVYAQIETLYTITARVSALRFTDYMR